MWGLALLQRCRVTKGRSWHFSFVVRLEDCGGIVPYNGAEIFLKWATNTTVSSLSFFVVSHKRNRSLWSLMFEITREPETGPMGASRYQMLYPALFHGSSSLSCWWQDRRTKGENKCDWNLWSPMLCFMILFSYMQFSHKYEENMMFDKSNATS